MIDKLIDIKNRFEEVGQLLGQPETVKDQKKFQQLSKEYRDLEKVVIKYNQYQAALDGLQHAKEILQKTTPLQEQEYLEIKKHPSLGRKILRPLKFLEDAGIMIDTHQERYDGKGYPEGLAGDKIPLGARIIAIADSFDAMTSVRPYRNQLSLDTARHELLSNAGKQFDPALVNLFLKLLDDGLYDDAVKLGKEPENHRSG